MFLLQGLATIVDQNSDLPFPRCINPSHVEICTDVKSGEERPPAGIATGNAYRQIFSFVLFLSQLLVIGDYGTDKVDTPSSSTVDESFERKWARRTY